MYKIIGADQKEYGPITADQLRQWISEGRINANTSVQADGSGVWKKASEYPEFAGVLSVTMPASHTGPITMGGGSPSPAKANLLAIWSMITGLISFLMCCWFLGPLPIILGSIALSQIKNDPRQTGSGFAITGIVLGVLSLIFFICGIIMAVSFPQYLTNLQNSFSQ